MIIINLSYNVAKPAFTDPVVWLKRISFSTGVLESLTKYGESVGIYHIHYKGIINKRGVTYHFPFYNQWQLLLPIRFNKYVKKLNPDVVIIHGLISPWQIIMLRWQVGKHLKIIVQHHAERPLRDIRQYFQRWADTYIGAYLFCAFDMGQLWVEQGQIREPKKIKEIMGTSSSFCMMDKEAAKAKLKISGDSIFLWVGGLDANKDPLLVANAFIRFMKSMPSVKLYMIYQSYQLLDELIALVANTHGASHFITLVGKVNHEELQYWYNSSDFIISSSHYEGSGIAVCEGLSCGCIPILTNIPSFRMMTDNGQIGFLYEAGNEDELVVALQKSLELNTTIEKQKVLSWFKNELSFDANARKIMQVIHELK